MNIIENLQSQIDDLDRRIAVLESVPSAPTPSTNGKRKNRYHAPFSSDQRTVLRMAFEQLDFQAGPITIQAWKDAAEVVDLETFGEGHTVLNSPDQARLRRLALEYAGWAVAWSKAKKR